MSNLEIRKLDKKDLQDRVNIFQYESSGHYEVNIQSKDDGWTIDLTKQDFDETFKKYDDNDKEDDHGDGKYFSPKSPRTHRHNRNHNPTTM